MKENPYHYLVLTRYSQNTSLFVLAASILLFLKKLPNKEAKKKKDVQVSVALTELLVTSYKTQIK